MKNRIFAIDSAPADIPVKPKIPATIAITRNMNDHLSITFVLVRIPKSKNSAVQFIALSGILRTDQFHFGEL